MTSNQGPGSTVIVDGRTTTTPHQDFWDPGSPHTLDAPVPASLGKGARYVFKGWSDGVTTQSREAIAREAATYEAQFIVQYELTIITEVGEAVGAGWYDQGSTAYAGLKSKEVLTGEKTRKAFLKWDGTASGTDFAKSSAIRMAGPLTAVALWKVQHYLTVTSAPPGVAGLTGQEWYDENAKATAAAPSSPTIGSIVYAFNGWSVDGAPPSGGSTSVTVTMDAPHTVSVQFKPPAAVAVRVTSNIPAIKINVDGQRYDLPQDFLWEQNTTHTLYVESPQSPQTGVRYTFDSWSDTGAQRHTVTAPTSATTYTATMTTEYFLTVSTPYGTAGEQGWYPSGDTAHATLLSGTVADGSGIRRVFTSWSGSASGTDPLYSSAIKLDAAKTATANWKTQYYLTVNTSPPDLGVIPGENWYDSGATPTLTAPDSITKGGTVYNFTAWTVDGAPAAGNPIQVTMSAAHTATANYR